MSEQPNFEQAKRASFEAVIRFFEDQLEELDQEEQECQDQWYKPILKGKAKDMALALRELRTYAELDGGEYLPLFAPDSSAYYGVHQ